MQKMTAGSNRMDGYQRRICKEDERKTKLLTFLNDCFGTVAVLQLTTCMHIVCQSTSLSSK